MVLSYLKFNYFANNMAVSARKPGGRYISGSLTLIPSRFSLRNGFAALHIRRYAPFAIGILFYMFAHANWQSLTGGLLLRSFLILKSPPVFFVQRTWIYTFCVYC